jgi:hypothetical protein
VVERIARDGAEAIRIEVHRTLPPVLKELKAAGYALVYRSTVCRTVTTSPRRPRWRSTSTAGSIPGDDCDVGMIAGQPDRITACTSPGENRAKEAGVRSPCGPK